MTNVTLVFEESISINDLERLRVELDKAIKNSKLAYKLIEIKVGNK